ncbi:polysaccharide biosynthesis tyrosine autokinase [Flavobacterium franklandianum]|uniref:GumC family protein n=1 Tax=Flavobacterium franklandianum TaxID=2594430 RepID=UPI00117A45D0|nr:polysaccharide biosynthesis tyrosine autokinase [Flavobacterium franklandianum]TRX29439.1 polysaccharide biosynthesis tyrosine autokinase [Flavobacterium franklandianum]
MKDYFMSDENQEEKIHLRDVLEKYLTHWKWFVLGVFLCFGIAFFYLRYTTPQYQASTTILVKDEKKGGMLSELSAFADMGLGSGLKSNVDNEVEILRSRSLIESTVKKLELNISIFEKGRVNTRELYTEAPIEVHFTNVQPSFYTEGMNWEYVKLSPNTFELVSNIEEEIPVLLTKKKEFRYGEIIPTLNGDLIITKNFEIKYLKKLEDKSIFIVVTPFDKIVASYQKRLVVDPISKTSSVVGISLTDPIFKRAEVFLDNLIQIYNDDAAADKNFISENTSKFISSRLILITQELDGVEKDVESFKTSNSLTDIESEAKLFIEGSSEYNKKSVENEIQLNVVSSLLDFMKKSTNGDLLPSNIISGQTDASALINSYNQLVLNRNRILKSATLSNPSVVKLEEQITSLKANVAESLTRMQSNLTIQKRNLKGQEGLLDSKIGKIPVQERQFRVIARQQKVKEELYLYLLQKREETAISLAATAPNARVIDVAKASKIPVSPKKNIIYLGAILMGLLIPFGILYVLDLFDTKVKNRFDITDKLNIPFLGDVPKSMSPNEIIDTTSRTSTAEALRIVRANLEYMLTQVPDDRAKSIFVTSTIPGEGKTFLSVNLASIFAHSGKKVILIGMDIRKPKLNEYVGISDPKGLTDYLSAKNVPITNYISPMKGYDAFDVLLGGIIPPNPTEMLMSKKVDELFAQFKKEYDYIVVDTAPVSLVSDTLIVAKHADTFVYVVRANYLDKRTLTIPDILHKENKLPNMAFILNDTEVAKGYGYGGYGYGYGNYGYGVTQEKKPWYKEIFNR